jgi:hypothetical protein
MSLMVAPIPFIILAMVELVLALEEASVLSLVGGGTPIAFRAVRFTTGRLVACVAVLSVVVVLVEVVIRLLLCDDKVLTGAAAIITGFAAAVVMMLASVLWIVVLFPLVPVPVFIVVVIRLGLRGKRRFFGCIMMGNFRVGDNSIDDDALDNIVAVPPTKADPDLGVVPVTATDSCVGITILFVLFLLCTDEFSSALLMFLPPCPARTGLNTVR